MTAPQYPAFHSATTSTILNRHGQASKFRVSNENLPGDMSMRQTSPTPTDFSQPDQSLDFLRNINVTDMDAATSALETLLQGMAISSPEPLGQLRVLEEVRPALDYVMGEVSKRYASRPLPPLSNEEETLQQVVRLWRLMENNYGFVVQRLALQDESSHQDKRALLCQRRLRYHSLAMIEFFRAHQEIPADYWRDLHRLFAAAERAGVASVRVSDPLNETWAAQSAQECYIATLLIDAASPYSRTPREFLWLIRWALRFAPHCTLHADRQPGNASSYLLSPEADFGLRPALALPADTPARSLETTRLASHIQVVVAQLKGGVSASPLGLGEDCVQPACARLLVSLYRPWGLASAGRRFPRTAAQGQIRVCVEPAAVAFFMTGKPFTQPDDVQASFNDFTRTEAMLALGERVEDIAGKENYLERKALELGYVQELWDVLDQSVTGFRLMRADGSSRIDHRQLIGLRTDARARMMLAEISWLQYQQRGTLCAGISMLPGPPMVLAVKLLAADRRNGREPFRLGFLIPGVPVLKTDPSLIVPAGWFAAERRVEVRADEHVWVAQMTRLISRGANFDRIGFTRQESAATGQPENAQ
ncbi:MAG: hypothetical protein CGU28_01285 [Candidatus Dactylopiibacterium carminicum]|nr:MAG: hypothetical protein CGU28_01285 [Candidatus Dactylopiibacterium carminicum]